MTVDQAFVEALEPRTLFSGTPLLPDLRPAAASLANWRIGASPSWMPGRVLLRFDNQVNNIGQGPLELNADQIINRPVAGQTVTVSQRVYNSDGTSALRPAGTLTFHDSGTHHHWHFDNFALYNLRAVAPGGGVGDIVRTGTKASFCLLDSRYYVFGFPGQPPLPVYGTNCYPVSGISVGYGDLYDLTTDFQWIDVTGLPSGQYYLESIADPDNRLLETNEDNNVVRILINLNVPRLGDANGDGLVDTADFKILMGNLGQSHLGWSDGDFNGDGKAGLEDLQTLELGWFGADVQAPAASPAPAQAAAMSTTRRLNPVLEPSAKRPGHR